MPMLLSLPAAAQDAPQGMLLLHADTLDKAVDVPLPRLAEQGCNVWRRGSVTVTDGKLDAGSPDRFVLFDCSVTILANAESRAVLAPILSGEKAARAIEGPIQFRSTDEVGSDAERAREYIFKISSFNNIDPDGRVRDLDGLNAEALARADAWKVEAVVSVAAAIGMERPDIVTVIYYDDPQQGERFRKQNKDILKQIAKFNRAHLDEFVYVGGEPD
ncbi:MAG: hypothetical protein ACTSX7_08430 [Alphaproteobacteria bacterium]